MFVVSKVHHELHENPVRILFTFTGLDDYQLSHYLQRLTCSIIIITFA